MDSRERILTALRHQESDRVPFDLGGTNVTGIHWRAYSRLRSFLGLPLLEPQIIDHNQTLADVSEDLKDLWGADLGSASLKVLTGLELQYTSEGEYDLIQDAFGIQRRRPKDGGLFFDLSKHPLAGEITLADVERYPWPDPLKLRQMEGYRERAEDLIHRQRRAVVVGSCCAGLSEMHAFLRGYNDYYLDLGSNHNLAEAIMDKILELKLVYWKRVFALLGDNLDVVQEADDLAGQAGMLISPRVYRKLIKPRHKVLFDFIHSNSSARIFLHSCGAVRPIIPDLIEIGVDILNPVQSSAANMEPESLKREFGKDLTFWGGGVDTQQVLGSGTPAEVWADVRRRVEALLPGGGFVFAAVHNIQADVPPENIHAMWQALRDQKLSPAPGGTDAPAL